MRFKAFCNYLGCSLFMVLGGVQSAVAHDTFYSAKDFELIEKIDSHFHINAPSDALVEAAGKLNFRLISINVDYPDFPPVARQLEIAVDLHQKYPDDFAFAGTFSMDGWAEEQWVEHKIEEINNSLEKGAVAIKVWKNVGMSFRDGSNQLVMVDDKGLAPIFDYMARNDILLIGHQGEPKNCWLPLEEMTVLSDKQYFKAHPQYHMHRHPELPSYEEQMEKRNHMLAMHPDLSFVGAHMASLEWSVKELASFLDENPRAVVDMAARIGQIQHQSMENYQAVRDFFIKYQDRILYATDLTYSDASDFKGFFEEATRVWRADWKYLATNEPMTSSVLEGQFKGLRLPASVIDKIYRENAKRVFKKAF